MQEVIENLSHTIREAASRKQPLRIRGGGTKDFYGGELKGDLLEVAACHGIIDYEPTELTITARAGTPLAGIESALRGRGQMLPFEPPAYGAAATLGGCIATGLSGPRRAYAGAARDFVLGVRILDGNGTDLRFGGQVMKNVAGYDVSRLMAGALGTLGVLLEVSLKVLPVPPAEATLRLRCPQAEAITRMNQWAAQPLPITATAWQGDDLGIRLSGAAPAVAAAIARIGGTAVEPEPAARFWAGIREQTDPYFSSAATLWRLSVKPTAPPLGLPGEQLIEWSGALRWLKSDADAATVRAAAASAGGHATLFRGGNRAAGVFQPLPGPLMAIHRRLKRTFDPAGILNPGRLYPDL